MHQSETGILGCKPIETPMDPITKMVANKDGLWFFKCIHKISWKANYLIIIGPDISYVVGVVSQFLMLRILNHWDTLLFVISHKFSMKRIIILRVMHTEIVKLNVDWLFCQMTRSTSGHCIFVWNILVIFGKVRNKFLCRDQVLWVPGYGKWCG